MEEKTPKSLTSEHELECSSKYTVSEELEKFICTDKIPLIPRNEGTFEFGKKEVQFFIPQPLRRHNWFSPPLVAMEYGPRIINVTTTGFSEPPEYTYTLHNVTYDGKRGTTLGGPNL